MFDRSVLTPSLLVAALLASGAPAAPAAVQVRATVPLPPLRVAVAPAPASPTTTFHAWTTAADLASGELTGAARVSVVGGRAAVTLDGRGATGTWTSPSWPVTARIRDLVPSWQAGTPVGSWIEVRLGVRVGGRWSAWYRLGSWSFAGRPTARASVAGQSDADGSVATDTYLPGRNGPPTAYRLRVVLHGSPAARPAVHQVAATTSALAGPPAATSAPLTAGPVELAVPRFSQQVHAGEFPAYGGGGEVWCSPTSVAMVLAYWHAGPGSRELATLGADPAFAAHRRADGQVDWAAAHTWDAAYRGAGNWPFSTAYAAGYGLDASVRQFPSLRDVETLVRGGVPVVASIAWNGTDARTDNDLDGAPIRRSAGHLLVVIGFTGRGDVVVNDPAAPSNGTVRRIYRRAQVERAWLTGSRGTVYLIEPVTRTGAGVRRSTSG